jgi:hypothetical protein
MEEGQVEGSEPLIAHRESAEAVEPGKGPFDDPAIPPERVAGVDPTAGDATADPTFAQVGATAEEIVALVCMQLGGPLTWTPAWSLDRSDRFDQVLEDERVVDVGAREPDRERDALAVDQEVAFRAGFGAVGGIGTDLLFGTAPLLAGTLEASRLARDQSIASASPKRSSRTRWRRCQTPAYSHSRKRRQQVTPLPQPSSWGRYSHGSPVLSTKMMPVSAARSGMRGRPPLGLGGSGGSSGAMASHSASLTSGLAIT